MGYGLLTSLITAALFGGLLLCIEAGRRIGMRRLARDAANASAGVGTADGAVFALLGLLIAFTFSGAAARFDTRRELIIEETNALGTAYLRLDLLPAAAQPALRELFRRYLDSRLDTYRKLPDIEAAQAELARSAALQLEIWREAVAAAQQSPTTAAPVLLVPALNEMFDITTTRTLATEIHPPAIIFVMLFALALTSALLAGYGMAAATSRSWLHMVGFAAALSIAIYVIIDMEFPRFGFIQVTRFDQALVELRQSWQ
jgi:hypothetical protein